jgi:hypothetical protein
MVDSQPSAQANWLLTLSLGTILSLILWLISAPGFLIAQEVPLLFLLAPSLITLAMVTALSWQRRSTNVKSHLTISALITLLVVYSLVRINATSGNHQVQTMMLVFTHLPLACWLLFFWAQTHHLPTTKNRYAFLRHSLNFFVTLGLGLAIGVLFTLLSLFLFQALAIEVTFQIQRIFIAGLAGFIPLASLALTYHPHTAPQDQDVGSGVSLVIKSLFRLFLLFALVFLAIYLTLIPTHASAPFTNREVLIVYNLLSFAVLVIALGSLPLGPESTTAATWLRRGLAALLTLAFFVLLYALAALIYRLIHFGVTPNRFTILGWDLINLWVLGQSAYKLISQPKSWPSAIHAQAAAILKPYLAWTILVILTASFIPLP